MSLHDPVPPESSQVPRRREWFYLDLVLVGIALVLVLVLVVIW